MNQPEPVKAGAEIDRENQVGDEALVADQADAQQPQIREQVEPKRDQQGDDQGAESQIAVERALRHRVSLKEIRGTIQREFPRPNVVAKLGGLAMPDNGFGWMGRDLPPTSDEFVEAQRPYYLHMLECFTPDRCMFESL